MSLLLAPYNNGMRLGQGFNSYTHQICVDNAVVVDPERAENVITNDGTTMRILAQKLKKASIWRQFPEYIGNGELTNFSTEPDPNAQPPSSSADRNYVEEPEFEDDDETTESLEEKAKKEAERTKAIMAKLLEDSRVFSKKADPDGTKPAKEAPKAADGSTTDPAVESSPASDAAAPLSAPPSEAAIAPLAGDAPTPAGSASTRESQPAADGTQAATPETAESTADATKSNPKATPPAADSTGPASTNVAPTDIATPAATIGDAPATSPSSSSIAAASAPPSSDAQAPAAAAAPPTSGTPATATQPADAAKAVAGDVNTAAPDQAANDEKARQDAAGKKNVADRNALADDIVKRNKNIADPSAAISAHAQRRNERAAGRVPKILQNIGQRRTWSMKRAAGTSQIVNYSARFVDKLSEISDDMFGSAALTIKTGVFNADGNGAFMDTNKFLDSDIRFYLSVNVVNQSICFKDALEYNPIRSISEGNKEKFTECFGDCFISGFIEGGDLHAVVLIKVINDAKKKDILAEAKVALTSGDLDIDGRGNVALARANLAANTETTILVKYSGGASIKNYSEKWTIDSLLAAANRFPYLVAQYPARTYAILTKYESLRTFLMLKPARVSPLKYENAALYTNTLMDAYLEYQTLFRRVTDEIRAVQTGVKIFKAQTASADSETTTKPAILSQSLQRANLSAFPATLEGLDLARRQIRKQMNNIVKEVDLISQDPSIATKRREAIYVGPASFRTLLPEVEWKVRKIRSEALTGKRLNPSITEDKSSGQSSSNSFEVHLFDEENSPLALSDYEQIKVAELERNFPDLIDYTRVTAPMGGVSAGETFCTVDIGLDRPQISEISVGQYRGVLRSMSVAYSSGIIIEFGDDIENYAVSAAPHPARKEDAKIRKTLTDLSSSERIISATIEVDVADRDSTSSVVGLKFVTNKGRELSALSTIAHPGNKYKKFVFEKPITDGYISGFWGRTKSAEKAHEAKEDGGRIVRLGLVWTQAAARNELFDEDAPIECISSTQLLDDGKGVIEFGREMPGKPQMIVGAPTWTLLKSWTPYIDVLTRTTTNGFTYSREGNGCEPLLGWMVLPELQDIHIQSGRVKVELEGSEKAETVSFRLPFKNGATPQVVCWIVDFTAKDKSLDLKVGVVSSTVKATHFDVKISTSQGKFDSSATEKKDTGCRSVTFGWLAHDKGSSEVDAQLLSGTFDIPLDGKRPQKHAPKLESVFASPPQHVFLALSALKTDAVQNKTFSVSCEQRTAEKLSLGIQGPADTTVSGVWVLSQ
ncbi:hypothetical protein OC835_005924 [Tilletia horrida]|nr:hypothetical protein OC835_005924 [Tilletia horrida]